MQQGVFSTFCRHTLLNYTDAIEDAVDGFADEEVGTEKEKMEKDMGHVNHSSSRSSSS